MGIGCRTGRCISYPVNTPCEEALTVSRKSSPTSAAELDGSEDVISVAIVEDDDWIRENLAQRINESPGFRCDRVCLSVEEALDTIPANPPNVVLMDINLPGLDGVEGVRRLKALCPDLQALMLTVYEEGERIFSSLQAGASGYLLKRTSHEALLEAIRDVMQGGAPMTGPVARKVVQHFNKLGSSESELDRLSPRENEVLEELASGAAYKEIADHLSISIETVRMNVKSIYKKLHVHSRGEAAAKFFNK